MRPRITYIYRQASQLKTAQVWHESWRLPGCFKWEYTQTRCGIEAEGVSRKKLPKGARICKNCLKQGPRR